MKHDSKGKKLPNFSTLSKIACVYAIYLDDTPWGRGKRQSLKYRPEVRLGDWLMYEYRLVKKLQPAGNSRWVAT